eukprot:2400311-Rhodomonas_salina.3
MSFQQSKLHINCYTPKSKTRNRNLMYAGWVLHFWRASSSHLKRANANSLGPSLVLVLGHVSETVAAAFDVILARVVVGVVVYSHQLRLL